MALSSGLYLGKLGQNFNQSELSAAIRTRHLVNKTAIFLSRLSVFSIVSCYKQTRSNQNLVAKKENVRTEQTSAKDLM